MNPPRVVRHAVVDPTEDGGSDYRRRVVERRIVQDVARVEAQVEVYALRDPELLRQRRIPLEVVRREEEVAARVANRTRRRRRELTPRRSVEPEIPATFQNQVTTVSRATITVSR